jgi:hypothetical protein
MVESMRIMSKPLHNTSFVSQRVIGSVRAVDAGDKLEPLEAVMGV